jgi:outer membrane protein, heavy metal efflux system
MVVPTTRSGRPVRLYLALVSAAWGALPGLAAPPAPDVSLGPPTTHVAPTRPQTLPEAPAVPPPALQAAPFAGMKELSADALVREVVARNPTLPQMLAAWQAAEARYPQVTSLDDPMMGVQLAPGAWGSRDLDGGVRVEISQRCPWPGKLALRGENARAEAMAAREEVEDARLDLVERARAAFAEYYLAARALEVNEEGLRLLEEFRKNAEARYKVGTVTQQDVLQAQVEVGRERQRRLTLLRMRRVAAARLNTLMHLPPDSPLPPPPARVPLADALPPVDQLRAQALERRPDLRALADRLAAEKAALALACKEFYPDFEVMAAYDSIWQEKPLRPQVGVRFNLPVRKERRHAAVAEAQARVAQRVAELARRADQAAFEVQQAYEQVAESEKSVRLYEGTILPAARRNVESAQSAYVTARIPFLSLVEAERNLVGLRERYHEAVADYLRRRAALDRAVGSPAGPLPPPAAGR